MPETAQQYTLRLLSNIEGKDPFTSQKAAPKKLAALLKSKSKKQLTRRPAPIARRKSPARRRTCATLQCPNRRKAMQPIRGATDARRQGPHLQESLWPA